jgi:hypothetical protein
MGKDEKKELSVECSVLDVCFSFDVGRSMFDVGPARNALKPVWGQFNHMIYISMFTRPNALCMAGGRSSFKIIPYGIILKGFYHLDNQLSAVSYQLLG